MIQLPVVPNAGLLTAPSVNYVKAEVSRKGEVTCCHPVFREKGHVSVSKLGKQTISDKTPESNFKQSLIKLQVTDNNSYIPGCHSPHQQFTQR